MERDVAEWAQGKTARGYTADPRIDCSDGSSGKAMVRKGGLEPPRPLGHQILSLARLPIPPLSQTALPIISSSGSPRACRHQRRASSLPPLMLLEAWFYLARVSLDDRTGPSTTLGTSEQQFPRRFSRYARCASRDDTVIGGCGKETSRRRVATVSGVRDETAGPREMGRRPQQNPIDRWTDVLHS